ncbi:major facilitator superfamily domain-containing protein [Boeremia exigua]|uniref:major facilitator superfamily domain-containing protein n=1 Tax=Boeremia exigua TaxID=749465 RepID=UPI001E8D8AE9|nr:major facilitator superfamily domain-containing protein [Boeremia exigua]KAH6619023.1 major facilitator superfamily domain-containing protein [Boeremia exigua]
MSTLTLKPAASIHAAVPGLGADSTMPHRPDSPAGPRSAPHEHPEAMELADFQADTEGFPNQTTTGPPIDGGREAWRLLLAAFVFESLLWGFPLSFGVFQEYYTSIAEFRNSPYISIVGTTASGISYLGAPLVIPFIRRWSGYRTHMILVGWPLCIVGLVAGSFADSLGPLILTQGVLYGIGFIIFYYPILSMVDEYWVRRRGMAYGLLCSASGVSGAVTPLSLQALLHKYGHKTTLRGVAVFLFVATGPLIPLLKGRPGQQQSVRLRTDWSFFRTPLFWIYSVSNLLMGLGYFFPALFLPSYARSLGLSASAGALLLALMSISQVAGQFTFGWLSDRRTSVNALISTSAAVAAIATLGAWGVARSMAPLVVFALLYGFFGAGYTAMWARMVTAVSEEPAAAQAMFGMFNFGKGVGNIAAGPISAGLLGWARGDAGYGLGTYKAVVLFTGVCLLLSAGSLATVHVRPKMS